MKHASEGIQGRSKVQKNREFPLQTRYESDRERKLPIRATVIPQKGLMSSNFFKKKSLLGEHLILSKYIKWFWVGLW